jgi:hypothetical protein
MLMLRLCLSSKVLSNTSFPISDLIEVYAKRAIAFMGFETA